MPVSVKFHMQPSGKGRKKVYISNFGSGHMTKMAALPIYSWLVGCFGFNGPLRQYFSLYQAVSQREGERGEKIDESKNVQTTPTRTYAHI